MCDAKVTCADSCGNHNCKCDLRFKLSSFNYLEVNQCEVSVQSLCHHDAKYVSTLDVTSAAVKVVVIEAT